jgi:hypothetical protein
MALNLSVVSLAMYQTTAHRFICCPVQTEAYDPKTSRFTVLTCVEISVGAVYLLNIE